MLMPSNTEILFFPSNNVIYRGKKFPPVNSQGPMNLFEINNEVRIVREPLKTRMEFLHSLDLRGVNKILKK